LHQLLSKNALDRPSSWAEVITVLETAASPEATKLAQGVITNEEFEHISKVQQMLEILSQAEDEGDERGGGGATTTTYTAPPSPKAPDFLVRLLSPHTASMSGSAASPETTNQQHQHQQQPHHQHQQHQQEGSKSTDPRTRSWSAYSAYSSSALRVADLERELNARERELTDNRLVVAELCARLKAAASNVPEAMRPELVSAPFNGEFDEVAVRGGAGAGAGEAEASSESGVWLDKKAETIGFSKKRWFSLTKSNDSMTPSIFKYWVSRGANGSGVDEKGSINLEPATTHISVLKECITIKTPSRNWELVANTVLLAELWAGYLQAELDNAIR
jgi:hypothetical protein